FASPEHTSKMPLCEDYHWINDHLTRIAGKKQVEQLLREEEDLVKSQQLRWPSMSLYNPRLRPKRDVIEFIQTTSTYADMNFEHRPESNAEWAEILVPRMSADCRSGRFGIAAMFLIEQDLAEAKTRCFDCKLIFANAAE
ncbi:hypothetical protein PMAYCL1PPCAC_01483, partial [Pristionchus mayeri]